MLNIDAQTIQLYILNKWYEMLSSMKVHSHNECCEKRKQEKKTGRLKNVIIQQERPKFGPISRSLCNNIYPGFDASIVEIHSIPNI